ncbi:hypothetical protein PM082_021267 [Marasmius tenuissimus]|nr:hypothetical protein PM082_021267 [Marasmius tenuissimus]
MTRIPLRRSPYYPRRPQLNDGQSWRREHSPAILPLTSRSLSLSSSNSFRARFPVYTKRRVKRYQLKNDGWR